MPTPDAVVQSAQAEATAAQARENFEGLRLAIVTRLAAGMLINPATYEMTSWEGDVSDFAMRIADRLLAANQQRGEQDERLRLSVATRVAAGMLANPATYAMDSWEAKVVSIALRLAVRMIAANRQG